MLFIISKYLMTDKYGQEWGFCTLYSNIISPFATSSYRSQPCWLYTVSIHSYSVNLRQVFSYIFVSKIILLSSISSSVSSRVQGNRLEREVWHYIQVCLCLTASLLSPLSPLSVLLGAGDCLCQERRPSSLFQRRGYPPISSGTTLE